MNSIDTKLVDTDSFYILYGEFKSNITNELFVHKFISNTTPRKFIDTFSNANILNNSAMEYVKLLCYKKIDEAQYLELKNNFYDINKKIFPIEAIPNLSGEHFDKEYVLIHS